MTRLSLRARIFAACFAMGAGIAVTFGAVSLGLLELMEFEQVDLILDEELREFINAHVGNSGAAPPRISFFESWAVPVSEISTLPPEIRDLAPGSSEVNSGARERRVAVAERGGWRYAVSLDLTLMEAWENRVAGVVILLVVLCTVLAAMIGRWLAGRVVAPVVRLADLVSATLRPAEAAADWQRFTTQFSDDEVGRLARALAEYSRLLLSYAQREREFSAQASHELRTPLAITATSLELALASDGLPARTRAQLERGARALRWMHETLEALMAMARAQAGIGDERIDDVGLIVTEVVTVAQALLEGKPVTLEHELAPGVGLDALPGAMRIVVRNLLVNACAHTDRGRISVNLDAGSLSVRDTGAGIRTGEEALLFEPFARGAGSRQDGEGLGLVIVRRICEHYGWQVSIASNAAGGIDATVRFAPARHGAAAVLTRP